MTYNLKSLKSAQGNIESEIENLLEKLNINISSAVSLVTYLLEHAYRAKAVLAYILDGNIVSYQQNMFLSSCVKAYFIKCLQKGMKSELKYRSSNMDSALYTSLNSNDTKVQSFICNTEYTYQLNPAIDEPGDVPFYDAFRMVIVGKTEFASDSFAVFEEFREGDREAESKILGGFLENDNDKFNSGLIALLNDRKEEINGRKEIGMGENYLFVEGVAYARLGIRQANFSININDSLIPLELLKIRDDEYKELNNTLPKVPDKFIDDIENEL